LAASFLQDPGLPFARVLDAEAIQRVFQEEDGLFGQEDIFSTQLVLWAFLAQTLRDGKGVACAAAVADIATYLLQTGQQPPSGDTGDYCRARAKLKLTALQRLVREVAGSLEDQADAAWLWKGLHAKLVDGFTFTMPDTPEMVRRELWVTLLAYNLIRKVMATAAVVHDKQPRQLGFTRACQSLLAAWMLLATGACRQAAALYRTLLAQIAANEVANRPGRIEPRVLKRRRDCYPYMQRPRAQLQAELGKT